MKRSRKEEELVERWTLFPDELALIGGETGHYGGNLAAKTPGVQPDQRWQDDGISRQKSP